MRKHTRALFVLCGIALLPVIGAGCLKKTARGAEKQADGAATAEAPALPTPSPVTNAQWVEAKVSALREYAPAVGTLRARQITQLGPLVSGRVAEVTVDFGDRVEEGQVLVRLERTLFEIEMQQQAAGVQAAKGSLAAAKADADYWNRELIRQQELFARGVGSQKELGDTQTRQQAAAAALEAAAGQLAQAEQALAYARQRLAETEIRAPYAGVVSQRYVDPGDMASTAPPTDLLEVRETDVLYLEFSLPQDLLSLVRVGAPVEFTVEGAEEAAHTARIDVIFPTIDEATRSFRCRATVDNRDQRLMAGSLARVQVVEREIADALVVPREALRPTSAGWEVFVSNDGRPTPRTVKIGLLTAAEAQIVEGLTAGEKVMSPSAAAG
jgi:RND family efflux transporter MFP subunit